MKHLQNVNESTRGVKLSDESMTLLTILACKGLQEARLIRIED